MRKKGKRGEGERHEGTKRKNRAEVKKEELLTHQTSSSPSPLLHNGIVVCGCLILIFSDSEWLAYKNQVRDEKQRKRGLKMEYERWWTPMRVSKRRLTELKSHWNLLDNTYCFNPFRISDHLLGTVTENFCRHITVVQQNLVRRKALLIQCRPYLLAKGTM